MILSGLDGIDKFEETESKLPLLDLGVWGRSATDKRIEDSEGLVESVRARRGSGDGMSSSISW